MSDVTGPSADASVPDGATQAQRIIDLETTVRLEVGVDAYVLAIDWLGLWRRYTGYRGAHLSGVPCGPIENSPLIKDGEFNWPSLYENHDYVIVTKAVWDQYLSWYGGGQAIAVPVVEGRDGTTTAVVKKIEFTFQYRDVKKSAWTHKFKLISELRSDVMNLFDVPLDTETRLIDYWNDRAHMILVDTRHVYDYVLYERQQILLDYKTDGEWTTTFRAAATYAAPTASSGGGYYGGSYSQAPEPGAVGLVNQGNTCYFNSGTQCLLHSRPLATLFLQTAWHSQLTTLQDNPLCTDGAMARAFGGLVAEVWSGQQSAVRPAALKHAAGGFAPQFSGWNQEDSMELVTFVLDGIHEDMNLVHKVLTEPVFGDGTNDLATAQLAWDRHLQRNKSSVVEIFHGQLRSRLDCPECRHRTIVFDPYVSLGMPVAPTGAPTVTATFVPFDFAEPRPVIKFEASADPSPAVSALVGRDVNVVLCSRSGRNVWLTCGAIGDESFRSAVEYIAFEIPSKEKFYAPCFVEMKVRAGSWEESDNVSGLFLAEVESGDATEAEVAAAAARSLECVWSGESPNPSPALETRVSRTLLPSGDSTGAGKVTATFYSHKLWPDYHLKYITGYLTTISINPEFATPESQFSLASLVRHDPLVSKAEGSVSLADCFNWFRVEETLDEQNQWYCPSCKQFVCAKKQMDVWSVPPCLIVHLKRFTQFSKLDTVVDFPDEFDISPFIVGPQRNAGPLHYRLYAVSNHYGSLCGGHYTAHARVVQQGHEDGNWYSFDDSYVQAVSASDAHTSAAYVLYYERVEASGQ
jgi:ubiquitin carboxyl-terminal hydrolase 4/11/15